MAKHRFRFADVKIEVDTRSGCIAGDREPPPITRFIFVRAKTFINGKKSTWFAGKYGFLHVLLEKNVYGEKQELILEDGTTEYVNVIGASERTALEGIHKLFRIDKPRLCHWQWKPDGIRTVEKCFVVDSEKFEDGSYIHEAAIKAQAIRTPHPQEKKPDEVWMDPIQERDYVYSPSKFDSPQIELDPEPILRKIVEDQTPFDADYHASDYFGIPEREPDPLGHDPEIEEPEETQEDDDGLY